MKKIIVLTSLCIFTPLMHSQVDQAEKIIMTLSKSWDSNEGMIYLFDKTAKGWEQTVPSAVVHFGSAGLAWGVGLHSPESTFMQKKEGDIRSPAGIFTIGALYGLDPAPPRGVQYPYRRITEQTRCIDDAASAFYNTIVEEDSANSEWNSAEYMAKVRPDYKYVLIIGHNASNESGDGSCIFMHINNVPTTGCTSMDEPTMLTVLQWLDPEKRTVMVQLPASEYRRLRSAWKLPAIPERLP